MKVQPDSLEERPESPELPEPLYEEVGDFGLQVLKSLETSFLSSSAAETQEVLVHPRLRLVPVESEDLDPMLVPGQAETASSCVDSVDHSSSSAGGAAECSSPDVKQQLQGVCTPSQELLLQELSSAFTKKTQGGDEDRPYDV